MNEDNPYQPPRATVGDQASAERGPGLLTEPRKRPIAQGWTWIVEAFRLFARNPLIWIVNFVIFMGISFIIALIPVLSIANNILGPIFTGGFMLGARDQDEDLALEIAHLFAGFRANGVKLAEVGALYLGGTIILGIFMLIPFFLLFGVSGLEGLVSGTGLSEDQVLMLLLLVLIFLALLLPLIMAYWFAPALIVFHDLSSIRAMQLSFIGCARNVLPFLLYGIVLTFLFVVGAIPLFLGLVVVAPITIASIYTAYKDIFIDAQHREID